MCAHQEQKNNWELFVLKKVRRDLWELLDKSGVDIVEEIPDTGFDGNSRIEWGVKYKSPTEEQIDWVRQNVLSEWKNKAA